MSALNKTILREIKGTFGRFISILFLIALGVFAFVGISVTGSNMRLTGITYSNEHNLADIYIQSTYGLDEADQKTLNNFSELTYIEYGYATDVTMSKKGASEQDQEQHTTLKVESLPTKLSNYEVIQGRLPEKKTEIVLDNILHTRYQLGDTIQFISTTEEDTSLDNLKQTEYQVVGFVNSPEYLTKLERGQSLSGKGELQGFAGVLPEVFDMDVYTIARAKADIVNESKTDKTVYDDLMSAKIDGIKTVVDQEQLAELRLQRIKQDIETELSNAEKKITDGKNELADNEQKLNDAETELADAKSEYYQGQNTLDVQVSENTNKLLASEQIIVQAENELAQAATQLQTAKEELDTSEQALQSGEAELTAAQAEWQTQYDTYLAQKAIYDENHEQYQQAYHTWEEAQQLWKAAQADLDERIAAAGGMTPALQAEQDILDAQKQVLDQNKDQLDQTSAQLSQANQELLRAQATLDGAKQLLDEKAQELEAGKAKLAEGKAQYQQAKATYDESYQQYLQGKQDIETGWQLLNEAKSEGASKLAEAWALISDGEAKLKENLDLFNEEKPKAEKEIADAETEVADARKDLDALKAPTYLVKSRNNLLGYDQFFDNGERIDVLAYIFPVFLFFIAALVTLTTMTRMVEEQRTQIGTMKALGYTSKDILRKYLVYGAISGGIGTILGSYLGLAMLPRLIYSAYKSAYIFDDLMLKFYPFYVFIGLFIAIICTIVPVIYSVSASLKEKATELMRPKAPKIGKRILLERIPFIWKNLSFNYKVTARNLFRYKQRMLMTVLGVSGCVALIIMGIGLRDSLKQTITVQLDDLYRYDVLASFNTDAELPDVTKYETAVASTPAISDNIKVIQETMEISQSGKANKDITVIVPQNPQSLNDFISLVDTKNQPLIADNQGVILSQKIAEVYHVKAGDEITLIDDDIEYKAKVAAINQWYLGHQVVFSPEYYQTVFNKAPTYNTYLLHVENEDKVSSVLNTLNEQPANIIAMTLGSTTELVKDSMDGLNLVMAVLLFLAIILAVIVLYNLTNINISERIRELSTIKVLGFYNKEVTLYIYRETILLTLIGIVLGWFLGTALEQFVVIKIPPDMVLFNRDIFWTNYAIASMITFAISLAIMGIMYLKLKHVDMIEALKSVE